MSHNIFTHSTWSTIVLMVITLLVACQSDTPDAPPVWIEHSGQIAVRDTATLKQSVMSDCIEAGSITLVTDNAWTSSIFRKSSTNTTAWLRLSPDHGDAAGEHTVRLLLERNNTGKERSAMIEFGCGSSVVRGTISQSPLPKEHLYRLTRLFPTAGPGRIVFDYGEDERLASVTIYNSSDNIPHKTLTFSYDGVNSMTYELSDRKGLVTRLSASGYFTMQDSGIDSATEYNRDNEEQTTHRYLYDAKNHITEIHHTDIATNHTVMSDQYIWDKKGNCIQNIHQCKNPECKRISCFFEFGYAVSDLYKQILCNHPFQLPLLLTDTPNYLHALGFYGVPNAHYLTGISHEHTNTGWEFEYDFTCTSERIIQMEINEECDAMTITALQVGVPDFIAEGGAWHAIIMRVR